MAKGGPTQLIKVNDTEEDSQATKLHVGRGFYLSSLISRCHPSISVERFLKTSWKSC